MCQTSRSCPGGGIAGGVVRDFETLPRLLNEIKCCLYYVRMTDYAPEKPVHHLSGTILKNEHTEISIALCALSLVLKQSCFCFLVFQIELSCAIVSLEHISSRLVPWNT